VIIADPHDSGLVIFQKFFKKVVADVVLVDIIGGMSKNYPFCSIVIEAVLGLNSLLLRR